MGYRSDVRIRLTKKDYERLVKEFDEKVRNSPDDCGYDMFRKNLDVYKELKNVPCWKMTDDGEDVEETHDCVFFGWDSIKWYDGYKDVDFIMQFIQDCDQYAFCRIGESSEGDIDSREQNMDMIGYYYVFEDEEMPLIEAINNYVRKLKKQGYDDTFDDVCRSIIDKLNEEE